MNILIVNKSYSISISDTASVKDLFDGSWIVILHAYRIPPHVGIVINGNYNSLTIKGHELDVNLSALIKLIERKKIEAVFVKLKKHPVFSSDFQKEIFQLQIKQYTKVLPNEASCLNPVKLFLSEFYAVSIIEKELLYELVERLKQNNYTKIALGLNVENKAESNQFYFPLYSYDDLQAIILNELNHISSISVY